MDVPPDTNDRVFLDEALFSEEQSLDLDLDSVVIPSLFELDLPPPAPTVRHGDTSIELTSISPGLYELSASTPASDSQPPAHEETELDPLPSPIQIQYPDFDLGESYFVSEQQEIESDQFHDLSGSVEVEHGIERDSDLMMIEDDSIEESESFELTLDDDTNERVMVERIRYDPPETQLPQAIEIEAASPRRLSLEINAGVKLAPGDSVVIGADKLRVVGDDPFLLDLILLSAPQQGVLLRDGFALTGGDVFTQEDVDHGRIVYRHEGDAREDEFVFSTPREEVPPTTFVLCIEATRHAPVLLAPGKLVAPLEGNRIAEFLQDSIRSHEPGLVPGLALMGSSGQGQWEYSHDGGASWQPVGDVAPERAFLLGPTQTIRFVPKLGWAGRISLSYRAWDRSAGEECSMVDLSSREFVGGSSAFSLETTMVTAIVKAPSIRLSVPPPWIQPATIGELLGDSAAIVRLEGCGDWQFSLDGGMNWQDFGSVFHGRARLLRSKDLVRFVLRPGEGNKVLLSARHWDGTGWGAGSVVNLAGHRSSGEGTAFGSIAQTRTWRRER